MGHDMFNKIKNVASNLGDMGEMGNLKRYMEGIDFPASKEQIIDHLQRSDAQDDIIAKVREVGLEQFKDQGNLVGSFMGKH